MKSIPERNFHTLNELRLRETFLNWKIISDIRQQIDNNGKRMRTHFAENPVKNHHHSNCGKNRWDCGAYYKTNLIFKAHVPTYQLFFLLAFCNALFCFSSIPFCTYWIYLWTFFSVANMILAKKKEITKLSTINKIIALLHRFTLR